LARIYLHELDSAGNRKFFLSFLECHQESTRIHVEMSVTGEAPLMTFDTLRHDQLDTMMQKNNILYFSLQLSAILFRVAQF
jgi:hypothetical protein